MKALVVGGSGFIGSHIVDNLLQNGVSVRVFDKRPEIFREPLAQVEYVFSDYASTPDLDDALADVDTVFHLFTATFPSSADLSPISDVNENLIGMLRFIDLMRKRGIRRLVFLSSGGTVYGKLTEIPVKETEKLLPLGSYGIVKASIEMYLMSYWRQGVLDPVIIRASNPYGPRQSNVGSQGLISTFINRIYDGKELEIWGDGSIVRDYVFVTELASLCVMAAKSDFSGPLNAGSGQGYSINQIADIIQKTVGNKISVQHKPAKPNDVPTSILDVTLAKHELAWMPTISIEAGIAETWKWLREIRSMQR